MGVNRSPVFVKKVVLVYKFESIQHLRFVVYDADEDADVNTVLASAGINCRLLWSSKT